MSVDFDALSERAMTTKDIADQNALWHAAFALPEWLFIARGEKFDQPYICLNESVAENRPMIKAFTDSDKLNLFARANKLEAADGNVMFISMKVNTGILDYMERVAEQGIHGIHFNANLESTGFYAPLKQLRPIYGYILKH